MSERIISVVAALIRDNDGRVLLVRKRGTSAFMQPGGKRDVDESDVAALSREIAEELGCQVVAETARPLGVFDCAAANEAVSATRESASVVVFMVRGFANAGPAPRTHKLAITVGEGQSTSCLCNTHDGICNVLRDSR